MFGLKLCGLSAGIALAVGVCPAASSAQEVATIAISKEVAETIDDLDLALAEMAQWSDRFVYAEPVDLEEVADASLEPVDAVVAFESEYPKDYLPEDVVAHEGREINALYFVLAKKNLWETALNKIHDIVDAATLGHIDDDELRRIGSTIIPECLEISREKLRDEILSKIADQQDLHLVLVKSLHNGRYIFREESARPDWRRHRLRSRLKAIPFYHADDYVSVKECVEGFTHDVSDEVKYPYGTQAKYASLDIHELLEDAMNFPADDQRMKAIVRPEKLSILVRADKNEFFSSSDEEDFFDTIYEWYNSVQRKYQILLDDEQWAAAKSHHFELERAAEAYELLGTGIRGPLEYAKAAYYLHAQRYYSQAVGETSVGKLIEIMNRGDLPASVLENVADAMEGYEKYLQAIAPIPKIERERLRTHYKLALLSHLRHNDAYLRRDSEAMAIWKQRCTDAFDDLAADIVAAEEQVQRYPDFDLVYTQEFERFKRDTLVAERQAMKC